MNNLKTESVPDPAIRHPRGVIFKLTLSSICGSHLHLIHGILPTMEAGDILGHEFVGEVVEVGADGSNLKIGARVVSRRSSRAATVGIASKGNRHSATTQIRAQSVRFPSWATPPAASTAARIWIAGFAGSHAMFIRVPFGDIGCFAIPDGMTDAQSLFFSDAASTAYLGAELYLALIGARVACVQVEAPVGRYLIL